MSMLIAYLVLTLVAVLWIARDTETIYIFDVFGKSFRYVWFESGQRWTHLLTYGWRLAALSLMVALNAILSYRFYTADPFGLVPTAQLFLCAAMLAVSFAAIPWIYVAHRLRWHRYIRCTALRLSDFAEWIATNPETTQILERAEYVTDEPWTAWHPAQEEWKPGENSRQWWFGLVPVAYIRSGPSGAAMFPLDWETFLAWNMPVRSTQIGSDLPVHGPLDTSFRVKSVQEIRGCRNWCVITTEMEDELDIVAGGSG